MCTFEDVLSDIESKDLSLETACKVYYPFLFEYGIRNLREFEENKQKLLDRNDQFIDSRFIKQITNIDMFYMMYDSKREEMPYFNRGIKNIHCVLHPDIKINIPLDTLFKLLTCKPRLPTNKI